jgi:cytochrome c biogenesis protein CcmG/thiol:disulfide interchange protein DsbE
MKNLLLLVTIIAALLIFGCNKNASELNKEQKNDSVNSSVNREADNSKNKAPEFTLNSPTGKKVSLSDYKGKVVIVDFWATWCPPCRKGIPDLVELQNEFGNKIAVIGISVDTDTKDQVAAFAKDYNINYTVLFATQDVVQNYGNIEAIPTSFVIDKNGIIVNQFVGLTPKETYVNEIKKLL